MNKRRLINVAIHSHERDILSLLNVDEIISPFARKKV